MNESVVEFKRELLKKSVAELCKRAGWESITSRVVEVLVEIMEKYILKLSVTTKAFSELCKRYISIIVTNIIIIKIRF